MADERDELDEALCALHEMAESEWNGVRADELAARARSLRARERKLAELAHAMGAHLDTVNRALTLYEREWAERYEEALK